MGYIKDIFPNSKDSHQVSPAYLLTFLRWSNRDTLNYASPDSLDVRQPLVVYNDAISIAVSDSKSSMSSTVSIVLKGGDINYSTAVAPGDFVFVNLVNWDTKAQELRDRAIALKPINRVEDGFKGVYKIQSVVKNLSVDRASGIKQLVYTVTAASFTEFNNVIYYNPAIAAAFAEKGAALWSTAIGDYYTNKLKANSEIQEVVMDLFKILVGQSSKKPDPKIKNYGNTHFKVPNSLGKLLGRDVKYVTDFCNYVVGIWGDSKDSAVNDTNLGPGFNPNFTTESNFITTGKSIQGNKVVQIENWNNQTAWSILQGNINNVLNEMYTTHRVGPDNKVYPTIVVRQKPFTSEHFKDSTLVTKFMQLPRWRVSADLLYSLQTAKNEASRFNFVQVFTRQLADTAEMDMAQQIALGNFVYDNGDIERNGLKPYVATSNFDFPVQKGDNSGKQLRAGIWSRIVSDWIMEGHMKESGVLTFQGIVDPIAVGDNIELDNVVYHIEAISHNMSIQGDKKSFVTTITVSYGMDVRSSKSGPVYPNMEHTDAQKNNAEDWAFEKILPGVSDTQNITGRTAGEEIEPTDQESFTPLNLRKKRTKPKSK
jgi:hypothetical protein